MKRGFYTIMSAQFFSSLADNALFIAGIEMLKPMDPSGSLGAALVPMFALFYVVLAPFLGAFADALPKGKVMFMANAIKIVGCLMMLAGVHPLLAYAVVGLGAAAYSPAKYGILTELLPPSQLVQANGWIEGLTIASIILGTVLGGQMLGEHIAPYLLGLDMPYIQTGIDTPAEAAVASMVILYLIAALFNLHIPRTSAPLRPMAGPIDLVQDFMDCNRKLWRDKLGQISLATTTLFWGASANLRYIVLAWAAVALSYDTRAASSLVGVVAIGTAVGALVASWTMRLDKATRVIPLGIGIGLIVILMLPIKSVWVAAPFLAILGAIGGFLVVPMNALLQHRGHNLMGAGRSIAVQNFNEQACILALGFFYSGLTRGGLHPFGAIIAVGLLVAGLMELIRRWHIHNQREHAVEVERLLDIARSDCGASDGGDCR